MPFYPSTLGITSNSIFISKRDEWYIVPTLDHGNKQIFAQAALIGFNTELKEAVTVIRRLHFQAKWDRVPLISTISRRESPARDRHRLRPGDLLPCLTQFEELQVGSSVAVVLRGSANEVHGDLSLWLRFCHCTFTVFFHCSYYRSCCYERSTKFNIVTLTNH